MGECCSDGVATATAAVMVVVVSMVVVVVSAGMVVAPGPPRGQDSRLAPESILSRYPGQDEIKSKSSLFISRCQIAGALRAPEAHNIYKPYFPRVTPKGRICSAFA